MKLYVVCNNFGEKYDGIGAFAKVMADNYPQDVDYDVFTSQCKETYSSIRKFLGLGMTKSVIQATKRMKHEDVDAVLIEYPFVEWNPLCLFAIRRLKSVASRFDTKVFCSIHEYHRVRKLRRRAIEFLCGTADHIFVSSIDMGKDLKKYCEGYDIRPIPSNIRMTQSVNIRGKDKNKFVFFGLINGTKAFDEMLSGWKRYNSDKSKLLYVLSGTKRDDLDAVEGITYIYNANDAELDKVMSECAYAIIPVKPEVDEKNGTFKTAALAGCISIGKFSRDYKNLPFVYQMKDYSADEFEEAFRKVEQIPIDMCVQAWREAEHFGEGFRPENVAAVVIERIKEKVGEVV